MDDRDRNRLRELLLQADSTSNINSPPADSCQKKFNTRLVSPTFFQSKPFDQRVEEFSPFQVKGCAVKSQVQTDDFQQTPLGVEIGPIPFGDKVLREFKRLDRKIGVFMPAPCLSLGFMSQP